MQVAFLIDRFRPGKGGLEAWTLALAARLVAEGIAAHVVSGDPPLDLGGILHHSLRPRGLARARRDRDFAERARAYCRERGFGAVVGLRHCLSCHLYAPHGGSVAASFAARYLARGRRAGPSRKVRTLMALEEELLAGPEPPRRVLAVSESVRADLAVRYPAVADRIRVVPNGVDLARFAPRGRDAARLALAPGADRVVLFLAGDPRLKGWPAAREVFRRLRREGAADALLVGGRRPGRLPAGARWLGGLDRPEEAFRAADLLLQPTFHDPFPLTTLEALACGTPVATTERNGALDHVGRDGAVRAVGDPLDVDGLLDISRGLLAAAPREEARRTAERFPLEASLEGAAALIRAAAAGP